MSQNARVLYTSGWFIDLLTAVISFNIVRLFKIWFFDWPFFFFIIHSMAIFSNKLKHKTSTSLVNIKRNQTYTWKHGTLQNRKILRILHKRILISKDNTAANQARSEMNHLAVFYQDIIIKHPQCDVYICFRGHLTISWALNIIIIG